MEDQDDLRFLKRFQLEDQHSHLNAERGERQEIVAMERGIVRVKKECREQKEQQHRAEQAGPRLLEAEQQELVEPEPPATTGIEAFKPLADRLEAGVPGPSRPGL